MSATLSTRQIELIDAYWRACNYLSLGMIYLRDNPLLKEPLKPEHIKNRLLGHWGSDPGQSFVWVHLNRLIREYDLNVLYISGPGHGAPAMLANSYLEGVYTEVYPDRSQDEEGLRQFFRLFSFPGGIGSHCTPETPGSIHECGELGYSLSHAYGAAFDNPDLIVAAVVGDGEAETGPLATSWHSNKFLNPIRDGAVLPILHLNGYKIANPTILARVPAAELDSLFAGYGYEPHVVEGDDPAAMHQLMAATLERCIAEIRSIQEDARRSGVARRPRWPTEAQNTHVLGQFLRDVMRRNMTNFRVFGPDETASNRLQAIYEATGKTWLAEMKPEDADGGELSPDGRVMEMLSEHTLEGWMEGYVLTGRHVLLNTYESFAHVVDSMVNQHAKWLEKAQNEVPRRAPLSPLTILITSSVWRQETIS